MHAVEIFYNGEWRSYVSMVAGVKVDDMEYVS